MAYNRATHHNPDWGLNEDRKKFSKRDLRRSWSMGKRYNNHDVEHLMQECNDLKRENTVYKKFIKNFLCKCGMKIKIIGENIVMGDENVIVNAQESVHKMESMIQEIMTASTKQELELEQVKNILAVVQKDLQSLNESNKNLVKRLNRVKEYIDTEMHPGQRFQTFSTGMTELRAWGQNLPEKELYKVSFDQIPDKSKPLVYHVLAKYGNYKETLPVYFGVAVDMGMDDNKEDFITRILTLWLYHERRNVKDLDKVFAELKNYALRVKEQSRTISEEDISNGTSHLSGSTDTIISKGNHAEIFSLLYQIIKKQEETLKLITKQTGVEQSASHIQEEFV